MFLKELFEELSRKHAAFCFGRMNPPTIGHGKLIDTVAESAEKGDYYIFLSQTQKKATDPLDYPTKVRFLKSMFPNHADHIVYDPTLNTIMKVAEYLYEKGYHTVTFVAGSDRLENFQNLLNSYNGMEGKESYFKFDRINFVSSGEREDGAEGISGISATNARKAAEDNNLSAFTQATGSGHLAPKLFKAVRDGMGLTLAETGGVGVVRGGNDPRYKMSLTRDVRPDTLEKEMRAYGLVGRKNPGAPTRQTPVSKNVGKGKK